MNAETRSLELDPKWAKFIPWWLLSFISDHTDTCWTNMVLWKLYGSDHDWYDESCKHECPACYCGKFAQPGEKQERIFVELGQGE